MKILFVINNLKIGGTRSSLLNLLEYLGNYDVDVELLVFSPYGEYIQDVPSNVKVIAGNTSLQSLFIDVEYLKNNKKFIHIMTRGCISIAKKIFGEKRVMNYLYANFLKKNINEKSYDAVVGFQEGQCNDFVAKCNAKKRIFWIHNNYENLPERSKGFKESYEVADKIIFVANASMETFKLSLPQYADKMCLIKNILLQNKIKDSSLEEIADNEIFSSSSLNIISVGRIAPQKAFDRVIEVVKKLLEKNKEFCWIIVGEGPQREELKRKVKANGLSDCIKFIGARKNPFPYIKQSDLFVLTSIYESQPMVIMEALTIGVPVISTNFPSSKELLADESYSLIVDNNVEGLYRALEEILGNQTRIKVMREETKNFQYNNDEIILKLFEVINS